MSKKEFDPIHVRLMKVLGMTIHGDKATCSDRPGVVYVRYEGRLIPLAFNGTTHKPLQVDCEHEALRVIAELYRVVLLQGLEQAMTGGLMPHVPDPEDFVYVFADEEPEPEVTSTADANDVIAHIKEQL